MTATLRVVILKPSKYGIDGYVDRFRWGFMPNSTVPHLRSMTPSEVDGVRVEVHAIDEYVHTDLNYLDLLQPPEGGGTTLLALVGVQSHQLHRALDLAAYATQHGCLAVIGGPHVMTCETSMLQGRGVSFALAEAELIWAAILHDAIGGQLQDTYGRDQRWQEQLKSPVIVPPSREDLARYVSPLLGLYPARGCPFRCNFCSVIKIAGRAVRSQPVETTMASLRAAKAAGVSMVMFTSDNFNKYAEAEELLTAMADEPLGIQFFVQCDTQIVRQQSLVELMARAGCFQMFVGVESFNRQTLLAAHKGQNRPETYHEIVRLCREYGISSHFSTIIGFPTDTEESIGEHLETLRRMGPVWSSFYILCPIPGTEQYDDFLARGLICEPNLDRFDATSLTWNHPNLSYDQMKELLFGCYRSFFGVAHALEAISHLRCRPGKVIPESAGIMAMSAFYRYCAWRQTHPMSGGVRRLCRDSRSDYRSLRAEVFDMDLAPLPASLPLPSSEGRLNQLVNPRVRGLEMSRGALARSALN